VAGGTQPAWSSPWTAHGAHALSAGMLLLRLLGHVLGVAARHGQRLMLLTPRREEEEEDDMWGLRVGERGEGQHGLFP